MTHASSGGWTTRWTRRAPDPGRSSTTSATVSACTRGGRRSGASWRRTPSCSRPRRPSTGSASAGRFTTEVARRPAPEQPRRRARRPLPARRRRPVVRQHVLRRARVRRRRRDAPGPRARGQARRRARASRAACSGTNRSSTRCAAGRTRATASPSGSGRSARSPTTAGSRVRTAARSSARPPEFAAKKLTAALERQGRAIAGAARASARRGPRARPIADVESITVGRLIRLTNQISDNFFAEMLAKHLDATSTHPGTTAGGSAAAARFARRFGATPTSWTARGSRAATAPRRARSCGCCAGCTDHRDVRAVLRRRWPARASAERSRTAEDEPPLPREDRHDQRRQRPLGLLPRGVGRPDRVLDPDERRRLQLRRRPPDPGRDDADHRASTADFSKGQTLRNQPISFSSFGSSITSVPISCALFHFEPPGSAPATR